jgi:hypothetical protein
LDPSVGCVLSSDCCLSGCLVMRNCSVAGRQRHQSPRHATNRRRRPTPDSARWQQRLDRHIARPPIRQATRGLTNHRQHTPHLVAGTTTAGAGIQHPLSVRTGQPHPAANPRRAAAQGGVQVRLMRWLDPCGRWPVTTGLGGAAAPCRPTAPVAGVRGGRRLVYCCLLVRDRSGISSRPLTSG